MKKNYNKGLTQREYKFCHSYVNTGDIKKSAIYAGYKVDPENAGNKLLQREDINSKIEDLYVQKKKNLLYKACSGYEKLAFGSIADAIKLLYSDKISLDLIYKMDLFNVSEIKKPRDGMLEIKFFDRFKALEKLQQLEFLDSNQNRSFYNAIENGLKVITDSKQFS